MAVRLLSGARRHFEDASITLPLFAFAPARSTYIVEIIIINRIEDEAIQCLGHWLILEPRHSPESKHRIAAHLGDIRTGSFCCVHFLHLHSDMYARQLSHRRCDTNPRFHVSRLNEVSPKGLAFTHANEDVQ